MPASARHAGLGLTEHATPATLSRQRDAQLPPGAFDERTNRGRARG
jgi:hypothetical protein